MWGFESALQLCEHIVFLYLGTLTLKTIDLKFELSLQIRRG